jgi:hypothetical protein
MTQEQVALIAKDAIFRPRSRLWELHERHVPFDQLVGRDAYEQKALGRLLAGTCVAVIGPSGAGKSSVIAWLCSQLPASHLALPIPVTGVSDPGSVGEVARLALSAAIDRIMFAPKDVWALEEARAESRKTIRSPARGSAKLGGGVVPAEVSVSAGSLQEELMQGRLGPEYLHALNDRLISILSEAGITPVFVFEDTEATVGGTRAEAFFAGPLTAFVEHVDAPTLVAVQTHLQHGSRAFARLAPAMELLTIPAIGERARSALVAILARRAQLAEIAAPVVELVEPAALGELSGFLQQARGDLRRVLAAVHEAAEHAAGDSAAMIGLPHALFGIEQWRGGESRSP